MPLYKGATEITSGKLYKGATNIENGYKEIDPFYVNETTVSFATPTGQGFSYTTPSPQSSTGVPGSAFPSTTFVISGGSQAISGTASVSGLPSTLSVTNQSYSGSGPGNSLTITIGGTFPTTSSLNTALTISGLSTVTYYTVSLNYSGLTTPTGGTGVSRSASISGTGAINVTNNGSTWTGQFPAGTSIRVVASYSASQSGAGGSAIDYRQNVFDGGYAGGSFTVSSPFTMSGGAPSPGPTHSVSSSATTLNGNASYSVSSGYSILAVKTWGFSIGSSSYSGASNTATVIASSIGSVGGYNAYARGANMQSTTNSGIFLSYFQQYGGPFTGYASGTIAANDFPRSLQVTTSATGTSDYQFTWGSGTVYFSVTFS